MPMIEDIRVRLPIELREAINARVKLEEGHTVSSFIRDILRRELAEPKKAA